MSPGLHRAGVLVLLGIAALGSLHGQAVSAQSSPRSPAQAVVVDESTFIAIRVRDVARMAEWYAGTFGLEPKKSLDGDSGSFSIRILGNEVLTVELIEQRGTEDVPDRQIGLFKVGLYVEDAKRALAQFRALAAIPPHEDVTVFVDEPLDVRTFVIRDPEGNRLQFFERCDGAC